MTERQNINRANRTVPLNVSGQSLLSGNVFCGHCKGRLTLTTNVSKRKHSDGGTVACRRARYVCYNKTRKKMIASMIINRVYVYATYQLEFEFNIDFEQFELGLDKNQ